MDATQYHITTFWGPRLDSLEAVGDRYLQTLDAFNTILPFPTDFSLLKQDRREAYDDEDILVRLEQAGLDMDPDDLNEEMLDALFVDSLPLYQARHQIIDIVKANIKYDDDREPDPRNGYWLCSRSQPDQGPEAVSFTANVSNTWERGSGNRAEFKTDNDVAPDPAMITFPIFKSLLWTLVSTWRADFGLVKAVIPLENDEPQMRPIHGGVAWELVSEPRPEGQTNWMAYFSPQEIGMILPLPSHVLTEWAPDGGMFLYAAKESFDPKNPRHIAGSKAIEEARKQRARSR